MLQYVVEIIRLRLPEQRLHSVTLRVFEVKKFIRNQSDCSLNILQLIPTALFDKRNKLGKRFDIDYSLGRLIGDDSAIVLLKYLTKFHQSIHYNGVPRGYATIGEGAARW